MSFQVSRQTRRIILPLGPSKFTALHIQKVRTFFQWNVFVEIVLDLDYVTALKVAKESDIIM